MKIHLHVGVHKTATTYMQWLLRHRLAELNAAGIGFMRVSDLRGILTHSLMTLPPDAFHGDDKLQPFFARGAGDGPPRGVIISDENLIGEPGDLVQTGSAYRQADKRLRQIRQIFAPHDIKLFVCVRSYDTFLASMYCEAIRHRREFIPFADFRKRLDIETCRWPAVLDRFRAALQPSEVVVWRFEDFAHTSADIIRKLAFDTDISFGETSERRASLSQKAVDVITDIAEYHGPVLAARLVGPVATALPKGEEFAAFDPWRPAERREFRRMYEDDCRALPGELQASPVVVQESRGGALADLVARLRARVPLGGRKARADQGEPSS